MRLMPIPAFDDNYIWTVSDQAGRALVVDPGDADPVLRAADNGLQPLAVFITHHHADHVGGLAALLARWPTLAVYAPDDPRIPQATQRVADGDRVDLPELALGFEVIAVPGHTRSHLAYVQRDAEAPLLFCGDTLFHLGCGRLFEGTPAQMHASLQRLAALPDAAQVCCTHEYTLSNARFALAVDPDNPDLQAQVERARRQREAGVPTLPSTLGAQRAANPFLRCHTASVRNAVERHLGRATASEIDTFAGLRGWKDGYR